MATTESTELLVETAGDDVHRYLRTSEVAALFQVSERAVTDWAARGRLPSVRTPGGHRRYPVEAVRELLERSGLA
jgi:excisionase family DNA binding protein